MVIKEFLDKWKELLNSNGIEDANLKLRMLLSDLLNKDINYIYAHLDDKIPDEKIDELLKEASRLNEGEPIQYVIHKAYFWNLEIYVDENVLIPQPDTECLVEKVIDLINLKKSKEEVSVLDLCTGSGIIAIALSKSIKNINICASDISIDALNIAKKNAKKYNCNIKFIESDLFNNISGKYDFIVSNPPYVKTNDLKVLSKEVKHEPRLALDGGKDGMDFYIKIIKNAKEHLNRNGFLCMEIGKGESKEVENLLRENNYNVNWIYKDLSGIDRVIIGGI